MFARGRKITCPLTKCIDSSKDLHSYNFGKGRVDNCPAQCLLPIARLCAVGYTDVSHFSGCVYMFASFEVVLMNGVFIEFLCSFQIVKMCVNSLACPHPQPGSCLKETYSTMLVASGFSGLCLHILLKLRYFQAKLTSMDLVLGP